MPDDKTQEERIKALEAEIAALRKPVIKEAPLYRTIPGQVGLYDRNGARVQLPDPVPSETTVGGSAGFGSPYRTNDDGTRQYAPDGVPRDINSGEVLSGGDYSSTGVGPGRSVQHQQAIDYLDRAFPTHRSTPKE